MTDHTTAILAGSHLRKRWDGALPRLNGRTFGPPTDPTRRRAFRIDNADYVYRKGVKDDLSRAERASWRKVVEEIKHG